jgi:hypothetical protein
VSSVKLFVRSGEKKVTWSRFPMTGTEKDDTPQQASVPTPVLVPFLNPTYPFAPGGPKPRVDEDVKMPSILKFLY